MSTTAVDAVRRLPPAGTSWVPGGGGDARGPSAAAPMTFEQATARVLATLQEQMPLGVWAVTRREGDRQLFLEVRRGAAASGADPLYGPSTGDEVPWNGSLCQAMVDEGLGATPDATVVPAYAGATAVRSGLVRTYVAARIAAPDGDLFGTLCGYGPEPGDLAALELVAPVVQLLADLLGQVMLSEELRAVAEDREAHLVRLATIDHLTGLATRAVFHDRLAHALDLHRSSGRPVTVVLLDVDDFKAVNDTHGHGAGDALLAELGQTWSAGIRPGDTFARTGGDEFAVLVETGASVEEVLGVVRRGLAQPLLVPGTAMRVTTSFGLAHLGQQEPTPTAEELLARADRALYAVKAAGGAGVSVADG